MAIGANIKAIIFDLDGTLVDLLIDWNAVKQHVNKRADQSFGQRVEELIEESDTATLEAITGYEMAGLGKASIKPELANILNTLRKSYKVAILTRNSRHVAEEFLRMCGMTLQDYFVVGREDVSRLKPHPEGLQIILDKFHVRPEEAVLVGDTNHDIELADKYGLYSVLVGNKASVEGKSRAYQTNNLSIIIEIIDNIKDKEGER